MGESELLATDSVLTPPPHGPKPEHEHKQNKKESRTIKRELSIGTWNVRRGLIKRELEISNLLQSDDLDILFLTETDIKKQNVIDYKIKGYTTHIQSVAQDGDLVRVIALTKDNIGARFELKQELMQESYPSIWIEVQDIHGSKTLIGGFYRLGGNSYSP